MFGERASTILTMTAEGRKECKKCKDEHKLKREVAN